MGSAKELLGFVVRRCRCGGWQWIAGARPGFELSRHEWGRTRTKAEAVRAARETVRRIRREVPGWRSETRKEGPTEDSAAAARRRWGWLAGAWDEAGIAREAR